MITYLCFGIYKPSKTEWKSPFARKEQSWPKDLKYQGLQIGKQKEAWKVENLIYTRIQGVLFLLKEKLEDSYKHFLPPFELSIEEDPMLSHEFWRSCKGDEKVWVHWNPLKIEWGQDFPTGALKFSENNFFTLFYVKFLTAWGLEEESDLSLLTREELDLFFVILK